MVADSSFSGFDPLVANYIYCPNDFLEVCLRHESRCVVRIVAYILRQTLGYLDKNGNPVKQNISVSYLDIVRFAGVSIRSIRKALDRAIEAGYIECVTPGRKKSRGQSGRVGEYRLRWACEGDSYTDDPKQFKGFYRGEGHRSPLPNGYFDVVIPQETLAMAKVVGVVLRHTVGYANQFGTGRRTEASLSFAYIQQFANLKDPTTMNTTLKDAIEKNYIECVSTGHFDKANGGKESRAGTYAVKWLVSAMNKNKTAKTLAEIDDGKNPSGKTAKTLAENDGKNPSDIKTLSKESYKQRVVAAEFRETYQLLRTHFDEQTAIELAPAASLVEIQRQIEWLQYRNPENPQGMLRRAILGNWSEPTASSKQKRRAVANKQYERQTAEQAKFDADAARRRKKRNKGRETLARAWQALSERERRNYLQTAINEATSPVVAGRLQRCSTLDHPQIEALLVMAADLAIPIGDSL